jgi:hypothetical protein
MALFRRRKSNNDSKTKNVDYRDDKSSQEGALKEQVDDLQAEMNRLNKRLVEMQVKAQSSATASTSLSSLPRIHPDAHMNRSSLLRHDQSIKNQPNEINFVPKEIIRNGKDDRERERRPKLQLSAVFSHNSELSPPITEIFMTKKKEGTESFTDRLHTIDKMAIMEDHKKIPPQSNFVGDGGSITSSQRSTITMRNGRKVRRVVRKVRAVQVQVPPVPPVPPPLLSPPTTTIASKTIESLFGVKDEAASSLSSNTYNVMHVAEAARTKNPSRIQLSGANEIPINIKRSGDGGRIRNEDMIHASSRQTPTIQFATSPRGQHNTHENDMHIEEKHNNAKVKETNNRSTVSDANKTTQPQHSMIATGKVSAGVDPSRIGKYQSEKVSTSSVANPVFSTKRFLNQDIQSGNTPEDANISGIATESDSISNVFASIRAAGVGLNEVEDPSPATKTTHLSSDLFEDIRAGINFKQTQNSSLQPTNLETNDFLSEIQAGVKLKQVDRSSLQPADLETNDFLSEIQLGVKLKQVDISSLQPADLETNDFLSEIQLGVKLKQVDRSSLQPADLETNDFLSEIQLGVKLKQVDRSTLLPPKQKKTPMSALLAKIQERKQACMRRERETVSVSIEQSEIDW